MQRSRILLGGRFVASAAALLACAAFSCAARAATINYGAFGPVAPGVTFTNVTESSATDPVPLYGPPSPFATGLDFDPTNYVAFATNGPADISSGQLNFGVQDAAGGPVNSINSISVFEAGDFSLTGTGTSATQALAGVILRITVTEINGVPVAPIVLAPSNASVGFNLVSNPGITQPWSLGVTSNVDAQLPAGQDATHVEVTVEDQQQALSQATSTAFIGKREFIVNANIVPEPVGLLSLGLGAVLIALPRRRRARAVPASAG
jgi:hypothetical protein